MLIQARDYLRECGADAAELSLNGQGKDGYHLSICKMNMLLHGISHADIRNADTLADPQHKDENDELRRFDRVLANPPFSQNYAKTKSRDDGSGAKKKSPSPTLAASTSGCPRKAKGRSDVRAAHAGRAQEQWPHGYRHAAWRAVPGGEEREARQYFIDRVTLKPSSACPATCSTAPVSRPASWC